MSRASHNILSKIRACAPQSHMLPSLDVLRRQYFSLYPAYLLTLPPPSQLAAPESQAYLVDRILLEPSMLDRQPETGYKRSFWRRILQCIEIGLKELDDPELEVDERLYEALAELMASPTAGPSAPGSSYRTFIYNTPGWAEPPHVEKKVTLIEELAMIQSGTTGLRTCLHLAHHFLHSRQLLPAPHDPSDAANPQVGNRIVELGAGTGFLSILLSQLGHQVVATDLGGSDEHDDTATAIGDWEWRTPLAALRRNVELKLEAADSSLTVDSMSRPPEAIRLDWTEALQSPAQRSAIWSGLTSRPCTVVAADVIYDPDIVPALVAAIAVLLPASFANIALVAATVRNESTLELFRRTCLSRALHVEILNLPAVDPSNPSFWDAALEGPSVKVQVMRISRTSQRSQRSIDAVTENAD